MRRAEKDLQDSVPEWRSAGIITTRWYTSICSQAVYGMAVPDPKGYGVYRPSELADGELGRDAHLAIAASRFLPPDNPEFKELMRFPTDEELNALDARDMARAGVRSLKTLYKGSGYVSLRLDVASGTLTIKANRYRAAGHFEGIPGYTPPKLPLSATDAELGAAINAELAVSRRASLR